MYAVLRERYPDIVNRNRVILQQDNTRSHTSKMTMDKIKELDGIGLLSHLSYSPDLAPTDYYLFRSMAHFLRGRIFKIIIFKVFFGRGTHSLDRTIMIYLLLLIIKYSNK